MNKKQQMLHDRKLLQQLYSRLNITWQQKTHTHKNPILHRPQNNLISKSIAHKFYSSKRCKLNKNKQPSNKQSNHIFTNTGITKSQNHKRRLSQPQIIHKIENKQFDRKFERYQNTQLNNILTQRKSIKIQIQSKCGTQNVVNQESQTSKLKGKSLRAVSAHFTSRRSKTYQSQCFIFRKTCQNWFSNSKRQKEKEEIKGWDIEVDNLDLNLVQLKLSTQPY